MRLSVRPLITMATAACIAVGAAGCGSSSTGISDGRITDALGLKEQAGAFVMNDNPAFCSVEALLHDSEEVHAAAKNHAVVASRDGTVGIQVATPFAPDCRKEAEKKLDKLARKG
jgi:hypothetical protein